MANASLKKDFRNGEKLFDFQLNNNFATIEEALKAMNRIAWQDMPEQSFMGFRGTTEEINEREIINGQILYNTETGETFIDYNNSRISTGSGNAIHIGEDEPTNPATLLWINPNEPLQSLGTEVIDSMEGNQTNLAPSVNAIKSFVKYDELFNGISEAVGTQITLSKGFDNYDFLIFICGAEGKYWAKGSTIVPVSAIDMSYHNTWSCSQSLGTSVYYQVEWKFINTTTVEITNVAHGTWTTSNIINVYGVKLGGNA